MELKIRINNKEVALREILETINKIYLITIDSCERCKDKSDKEKLESIKKLIEGLGWKREK